MNQEELIEKLNRIQRYDLEYGHGYNAERTMVDCNDGSWLGVEDLASALGLWYGYVRGEGYKLCLKEPVYDD